MRGVSSVIVVVIGCSSPPSGEPLDSEPSVDAPAVEPPRDVPEPVDDSCFPDPGVGHRQYECNGIRFEVEVPAGCASGGCGIILDVHGLTMSAAMEDANTELRSRGAAAGFVVVQPSANPSPPQASWGADDEPRLFDILSRAIAVYAIDPDRVHMTGFSQGGFMTWRLLCDHADLFASVAPAAAAANCPVIGNPAGAPACAFSGTEIPARKVPILYMHGRADQNYIPYSCAQPQIDAIVAAWGLVAEGVVESSAAHARTRWRGDGVVLEHLAHDYTSNEQVPFVSLSELQGHCFPGSTDPGDQPGQLFSFKCEQPAAFVWGAEVVEFFVAQPRG